MRNIIHWTLLLICTGSLAFAKDCKESDIRDAISKKKHFDFDEEACSSAVIFVSKGIALGGGIVVDGKNKMKLSWTGEGSQCDEFPRNYAFATFYTTGDKNIIRNLTILKSPEGIHIEHGSGNLVDHVTFERICEDAITNGDKSSSSATDTIIQNSVFKNGPDKAIQCNGGSVTVQGSEFRNIPRAIGACTFKADPGFHVAKECPAVCHIKAYHNKVYGCSGYAFRGAGYLQGKKQGTLTAMNNYFENCKIPILASQYGYIYAEDNQASGSCEKFASTEEHGTGDICKNKSSCSAASSGAISQRCIKQESVPAPTPSSPPPPTTSAGGVVVYKAQGTGGSKQAISKAEREKLACSRASDRALVNARQFCSGKVVSQKTDNCQGHCVSDASSSSCDAMATVNCQE